MYEVKWDDGSATRCLKQNAEKNTNKSNKKNKKRGVLVALKAGSARDACVSCAAYRHAPNESAIKGHAIMTAIKSEVKRF